MINLMPPEIKQSYAYAQKNQRLTKWVIVLLIGLIGIGLIGTYGWVSLHQSIKTTTQQVATIQNSLNKNHLTSTESKVATISNDFRLVVKVLSQEILFSKLLSQMAAIMPEGTNLTSLDITNTTSGAGLNISAEATNYNLATQVQVNLNDPSNGIFSRSNLISITCDSKSATNAAYPCTVNLIAQFAQNNQFLFINQKDSTP